MHVHSDEQAWRTHAGGSFGPLRCKDLLTAESTRSKEFLLGLAELPPGGRLARHRHEQARIDFILSGRAHIGIRGGHVDLAPGDCIYYPRATPREALALGDAPARWLTTYACEALGHAVEWQPVGFEDAAEAAPAWLHVGDMEPWAPIEPAKGLRVRYRRVMDRARLVELIAGVAEIDPGTHYTRHWHDQAELYYILTGRGRVFVGDDVFDVRPGSAVYIPSRTVHGADSLGQEPLALLYVYGCETAGHTINWTPVEEIYADVRVSEKGPIG